MYDVESCWHEIPPMRDQMFSETAKCAMETQSTQKAANSFAFIAKNLATFAVSSLKYP